MRAGAPFVKQQARLRPAPSPGVRWTVEGTIMQKHKAVWVMTNDPMG
jgi:hypothetical protein